MKRIITFFLIIAAIVCAVTSCEKNDTPSGGDPGSLALVGKWQLTSITMNGGQPGMVDLVYEFKADGTLIATQDSSTTKMTYHLDEKENKLTITAYSGSADAVYQIVKLTQSEFSFMSSTTVNGETISMVYNFKKII